MYFIDTQTLTKIETNTFVYTGLGRREFTMRSGRRLEQLGCAGDETLSTCRVFRETATADTRAYLVPVVDCHRGIILSTDSDSPVPTG